MPTKLGFVRAAANNPIVPVFLQDSTKTDGSGKAGLTSATAGLRIVVRRELTAAVTEYKVDTDGNVEDISTLGTYAAPTAGKCRFKLVNDTLQPGFYEIQFAQALVGAADASRHVTGCVYGTGIAPCPFEIPLTAVDLQTNLIPANLTQVNGVAQSATLDTIYAAIQAQGPVAYPPTAASNVVVGTATAGTWANTTTLDGTVWTVRGNGGAAGFLTVEFVYACGTGAKANKVVFYAYYNSTGGAGTKGADVYAWNYATSAFEKISSSVNRIPTQTAGTTVTAYTFQCNANHMSSAGAAIIRLISSETNTPTTSSISVDYAPNDALVAGNSLNDIANAVYLKMAPVVYEAGIWIDTVNGTAGTDLGVNGTPMNPSNNYADAYAMATALAVASGGTQAKRFYLKPDTDITLQNSHANWRFIGRGKIHCNGKDISDAWFEDCELVDGVSVGDGAIFNRCVIGTLTLGGGASFDACWLQGTITHATSSETTYAQCVDASPSGSTVTLLFAANANVALRCFAGGVALDSMAATNTVRIDGWGRVILNSNCAGGSLTIRGAFQTVEDNTAAGFAGTITQTARTANDQINAGIGYRGKVTAVPGSNQFTIPTLIGIGAGLFVDAASPWFAYVLRDAGGAGAAPQGETQQITAFANATGVFTAGAFSAAIAAGDEVMIVNPAWIRDRMALPLAVAGASGGLPTTDGTKLLQSADLTAGKLAIKKNVAFPGWSFVMTDSAGNPKTGLTVAATRCIDGTDGACANAVVEVGGGKYKIDMAAADTNGNFITYMFYATGYPVQSFSVTPQA